MRKNYWKVVISFWTEPTISKPGISSMILASRAEIPWIYGAAIGSYGVVMPVVPERGPCFACVYPELRQGFSQRAMWMASFRP